MIVKSFVADSVAGALKMVRSELGGNAVVLKTRKLDPVQQRSMGGKVEVTACLDSPSADFPSAAPMPTSVSASPAPAVRVPAEAIAQKLDFLIDIFQSPVRKEAFSGGLSRLFTALLRADVPETLAHDTVDKLAGRFDPEDDYHAMALAAVDLLAGQLPKHKHDLQFAPGQKIALVGPPGAGKTSLMARLAGYLVSEAKIPVCLTSLDRVKVSAPEELQTYAALLDVDHFELSGQHGELLLDERGKDKITLIDTPAMNPRNRESLQVYTEKLSRIKPHRVLGVFSALYRASDLYDIIRAFKPFRLTELSFTMTDQSRRLGGVIAMSIMTGLPVTILGTGQTAGAITLNPNLTAIIRELMGLEEEHE